MTNLQKVAASENLPIYDTAIVVDALLDSHSEVILLTSAGGSTSNGRNNWTSPGNNVNKLTTKAVEHLFVIIYLIQN